ncbi:IS110 family transposase [Amycolatopsis cynarae]|uniref:IS110 family transposase n=1 Tax=Amycolatopsis cynarae TaxID=2995223 RepID=A0ABY7BBL1_9PSEU|nr:IS110 family transposase [Amycolatopsis sp. HUAS 11-8]WAL69739.1 IS110 family transposase [Amycolatopsis sp. HUAS 11-8]WAL69752.1 IS110 family transposase [Amycolatopsis sp. HUAS 11-8]WAL69896.1 IS110 family transposase [Amycolatopsis sp. HUAS 11-8]
MLFVGDDWACDHHDVEIQDASGRRLVRARLPEGVQGVARLHELLARWLPADAEPDQVLIGIETDRGPWVAALVAAGYRVFAVNPRQAARSRERLGVSGAKSDAGDAHVLADLVRTDGHQLREVAGDSDLAEGVQQLARAHQSLIWDRTRHLLRLQAVLREYFPAALEAFADLGAPEALALLAKAPDPARAARLSRAQITSALSRAGRRDVTGKAEAIRAALRAQHLGRGPVLTAASAAVTRSLISVITTLTSEISELEGEVKTHFGRHPDAEIYLSQPGLGQILGARVLSEFGDDPDRYRHAKARKNYAGTSPLTIASGRKTTVRARYVRNDRLIDALMRQAQSALKASPGARTYYDQLRTRGLTHYAALRQLANRLVGILHGCLKTHTPYNETTAWTHHQHEQTAA